MRDLYLPAPPPKPADSELGWLTWQRFSAGDASWSIWLCRCGEQVIRETRAVRKAVKLGRVPCCDRCKATRKGAA